MSARFSFRGRGEHSIRMPFDNYSSIVSDHKLFRVCVSAYYKKHPEVFPREFNDKYHLHDICTSEKEPNLRIRRIKLLTGNNNTRKRKIQAFCQFVQVLCWRCRTKTPTKAVRIQTDVNQIITYHFGIIKAQTN